MGFMFTKFSKKTPFASMASACESDESEPRYEPGVWETKVDTIKDGIWTFEGTWENMSEDLEKYEAQNFEQVSMDMRGENSHHKNIIEVEWD